MKDENFTLDTLPAGQAATVTGLLTRGGMRRRLLDLGFFQGNPVFALYRSPAGDPTAYLVCGAVIALRREDASGILVKY